MMNRNKIPQIALIVLGSITSYMCTRASEDQSASRATIDTVSTDDTVLSESQQEPGEYDYETLFKLETYLTDSTIVNDSMQVIDYDCAVLIYPTGAQIDEMIKANGEDDFYTIADDNSWYQGTAIGMIDSVNVKTTSATLPFLRLKGKDNAWTLDIRKKGLPEWNIVFFKTTKEPKIISAIDLTVEQVKAYFEVEKP